MSLAFWKFHSDYLENSRSDVWDAKYLKLAYDAIAGPLRKAGFLDEYAIDSTIPSLVFDVRASGMWHTIVHSEPSRSEQANVRFGSEWTSASDRSLFFQLIEGRILYWRAQLLRSSGAPLWFRDTGENAAGLKVAEPCEEKLGCNDLVDSRTISSTAEKLSPEKEPRDRRAVAKESRALTVAILIGELNQLRSQMLEDESEYDRLRVVYPTYLSFKIAAIRPDLKAKVLAIRSSTRHIRLAQELAGAHHGRELATIQDDWKRHKPKAFKRPNGD